MSSAIELVAKQELAWNGKAIRLSKAELSQALAPMFATFPGLEMAADTFNAYYMMLCDLDANKLVMAVIQACQAHKYPTQLVTIAAIREAYDGNRQAPGSRSQVAQAQLDKPIPGRMFRLDADEDRRQRLERLRQTKNWSKYYA